MKERILSFVAQEINRLTEDEDLRQELWVYFLDGHSPFLLQERLIAIKEKVDNNILTFVSMETLDGFKAKF